MTDEAIAKALHERLFADPDAHVFAILDGASIGRDLVVNLYQRRPEFFCLLPGDLEPDMAEVAPYVIELAPAAEFTQWVIREGWGSHWGIFATTSANLRTMRGHFRSLVDVLDDAGKPLLFRYYDPRVLRRFLPTCNAAELAELFGPTEAFRLEAEDPKVMLCFRAGAGELRTEEIRLVRA
jgi:hypothetical protein